MRTWDRQKGGERVVFREALSVFRNVGRSLNAVGVNDEK